jgi:hypothetical protein
MSRWREIWDFIADKIVLNLMILFFVLLMFVIPAILILGLFFGKK